MRAVARPAPGGRPSTDVHQRQTSGSSTTSTGTPRAAPTAHRMRGCWWSLSVCRNTRQPWAVAAGPFSTLLGLLSTDTVTRVGTPQVGTDMARVRVPAVAGWPVGAAMAGLAIVLTATSSGYGFHRDELYFRMLPPQWGYVDQPPLTPWLVQAISAVADQVWSIRILSTLAALATVLLVALVARELGGGGFAQGLAAWGYGFGSLPLAFGHIAV